MAKHGSVIVFSYRDYTQAELEALVPETTKLIKAENKKLILEKSNGT